MVMTTVTKLSFLTILTTTSVAFEFAERANHFSGFRSRMPNEERVDNIFNLLADIEPKNHVRSKPEESISAPKVQYDVVNEEKTEPALDFAHSKDRHNIVQKQENEDYMDFSSPKIQQNILNKEEYDPGIGLGAARYQYDIPNKNENKFDTGFDPSKDQYNIVHKDKKEPGIGLSDPRYQYDTFSHAHEMDINPTKDQYDIINIKENLLEDAGLLEKPNEKEFKTSTVEDYLKLLDSVSKSSLIQSKPIEEFLKTFSKVSKIYGKQKHKLYSKLPEEIALSKNLTENVGMLKSTATVIGEFLDPPNIEKVLNVSRRTDNEDEILELLTSVILGAENRSGGGYGGYGITLDPVTCIALLTLAAYLIRAVFQILTATTMRKRSLRDDPFGLAVNENFHYQPDIASKMVNVHNMISPTDTEFLRYSRNSVTEDGGRMSTLLRLPSEMALVFKLFYDGIDSCFRKFLCHHLAGRSLLDFGASEMFWSAVGLYKGEYGLANFISEDLQHKDKICETFSASCKNEKDESCSPCSTAKTIGYMQTQSFVNKLVEEFVHRSENLESLFN